jgi:glycosyltransferase involved in cell wall biosynthesis
VRLSIITPTLNPGPQLARTIRSVLDQDFDDLEHLIVDGGSTDGTLELVREYDHLRLVSDGDEGIFDAMNKGIAAAKGEWVYFLGADDALADESVLRDLGPFLTSEYDVVYGDVQSTRFGGRYDGPFDAIKIRKQNICHQAIFFRCQVFDQVGLFNPAYRSRADWDHNMRWVLNSSIRRQYVDRVIADYADHGYSSVNPDPLFQRDRLFRYLSYGRGAIPAALYIAVWSKEFALGLRHRDLARMGRAFTILTGA